MPLLEHPFASPELTGLPMRVAMRGQCVDEKICLMVDSEVAGGGWIGRGGAAGGTCARVALQDLICCEERERNERGKYSPSTTCRCKIHRTCGRRRGCRGPRIGRSSYKCGVCSVLGLLTHRMVTYMGHARPASSASKARSVCLFWSIVLRGTTGKGRKVVVGGGTGG